METVNENSEVVCTLVTIIVGAIIRFIERRKLRKNGKLTD